MSETAKSFKFGDVIENGWASDANPTKRGVFLRRGFRTGRMNPGPYIICLHDDGKTSETPSDPMSKLTKVGTIFDDHLSRITALEADVEALRAERDGLQADRNEAAARLNRLQAICARIIWTDYAEPSMTNDETKSAMGDLFELLFMDALQNASRSLASTERKGG